jgi:stress response protein SCP2
MQNKKGSRPMSDKRNFIEAFSITFTQPERLSWKKGKNIGIDYVLFLLNAEGSLSHSKGLIFFNQLQDEESEISMEDKGTEVTFSINLQHIRGLSDSSPSIDSFVFLAMIDETCSKTGKDLYLTETITLQETHEEPTVLIDTYEKIGTEKTIFLSRFFITEEGRLKKTQMKTSIDVPLTKLYPFLETKKIEDLFRPQNEQPKGMKKTSNSKMKNTPTKMVKHRTVVPQIEEEEPTSSLSSHQPPKERPQKANIEISGGTFGTLGNIMSGNDIGNSIPSTTDGFEEDEHRNSNLEASVSIDYQLIDIGFPQRQMHDVFLQVRGKKEEEVHFQQHNYEENCSIEVQNTGINTLKVEIYFEVKES